MFNGISRSAFLPFFFIFLIASIFRVTNLDLIEFKTDEAVNLLLASRPLFGHPFPPGGTVSSLGVLNPPLFNYILFPITAISLDPKFITFFIGFINSLAIAFLFLVIRKYYGLSIALITSVLMAFSPWAILYSRKIWMQDLLIPFFVVLFFSIHKLVVEKKQIFWLPYASCSFFLIQLHPISFLFIALITLFLFLQKIKINFKYIAFGLLIGLLPLIPYIAYEFANNCPDCQSLIYARNKLSFRYSPELFFRPLQILSQGNFRFILGNDTLTFAQNFPFVDALRRVFYFEYLLIPIGIFIFIKKFKNLKFLAYSTIALPFIYFSLKLEPFMHYYIIIMPLLFLFLAVAFDYFIFHKNLFLRLGSFFVLSLIIITSILFNISFFNLLKQQGGLKGDYGSAFFSTQKEIEEKLASYKKRQDYYEIYLASFISLDYMYGYQPLGRMIYQNQTSKERLFFLEKKLIEDPNDPRIKHELLAFYTKSKLTLETIDLLREKRLKIPQYEPLYKQVFQDYLAQNFKKEYVSSELGFRFFYPEHWKVEKKGSEITINGDEYKIYIRNLGKAGVDVNCVDGKNKCRKETIEEIIKSIRPY